VRDRPGKNYPRNSLNAIKTADIKGEISSARKKRALRVHFTWKEARALKQVNNNNDNNNKRTFAPKNGVITTIKEDRLHLCMRIIQDLNNGRRCIKRT